MKPICDYCSHKRVCRNKQRYLEISDKLEKFQAEEGTDGLVINLKCGDFDGAIPRTTVESPCRTCTTDPASCCGCEKYFKFKEKANERSKA